MGFSAVTLVCLSGAVAVFGWLIYQQILLNGRLLLRIDLLEKTLKDAGLMPSWVRPSSGLPIGSFATEFILPTLDGSRMTLTEWRGRRVLLVFFNPRCAFCRAMVPELAGLPVDGTDMVTLVVSTGGIEENRRVFESSGIKCPVLLQSESEVAQMFRIEATPAGYVLDERGVIASELARGANAVMALAHASGGDGGGAAGKTGMTALKTSRRVRDGLRAGTIAPSFRLPDLVGRQTALESFRGRPLLLVFSDPDCGPCNVLAPRLQPLHDASIDLQVVMISRRDAERNRAKAKEYGLTFPILLQRHWEISRVYGMFAMPIGYLIDAEGVIAEDVAVGAEAILTLASRFELVQVGVTAGRV